MKLNRDWHSTHKMPENAAIDKRIEWHLEHSKNCKCRPIPEKLKAEIQKRGLQES